MNGRWDATSVVPSGWREERRGDAGHALAEEVTENPEWIELTLAARTKQRREHVLRLRAEPGAITARDFAIHDGGSERLFRAPVGRVDRRVVQETEERRPLAVQMGGKPPHGRHVVGWSKTVLNRACRWPRATATPCADIVPAACRSRTGNACCSTACA